MHSPNGRHLLADRAVLTDCHRSLEKGGNPHWSREPIMQRGIRQSHSIFRPTNHKRVMPANWRPFLIPPLTVISIATKLGLWNSHCKNDNFRFGQFRTFHQNGISVSGFDKENSGYFSQLIEYIAIHPMIRPWWWDFCYWEAVFVSPLWGPTQYEYPVLPI